jgi:ABC-type nitrate/sulfonate/bicarbonate transport system substrate-binding protein
VEEANVVRHIRHILLLKLLLFSLFCNAQTPLIVKAFPGATALPLIVGTTQGFYEKHGLKVEVLFTQTSQEQRDDLAKGMVQIAHTAVDNAVAMGERSRQDVVVVAGGDSSMNEIFVQPDIRSFADLRGRTLVVDSPNTAYALQARKILLMNGLKAGIDYKIHPAGNTGLRFRAMQENREYAAAMLGPPTSANAPSAGFRSLGRAVDLLGAYQAGGVVAQRSWAQANADALERYLAGLVEATRWTVAPQNRAAGAKLLTERFKLDPKVAAQTMDWLADPRFGLAPDARLDLEGFRNVLALRAELEGDWGGKPPGPEKYLDLHYYDNAMKRLGN